MDVSGNCFQSCPPEWVRDLRARVVLCPHQASLGLQAPGHPPGRRLPTSSLCSNRAGGPPRPVAALSTAQAALAIVPWVLHYGGSWPSPKSPCVCAFCLSFVLTLLSVLGQLVCQLEISSVDVTGFFMTMGTDFLSLPGTLMP